jgi:HEAT repeat protein
MELEKSVIDKLFSEDVNIVKKTVRELAILKKKECLLPIYRLARNHPDKWVRVEAFESLEKLFPEKALYFSMDRLEDSRFAELLPWYIKTVAKHKIKDFAPQIEKYLLHEDPRVRSDAAEALEELQVPDLDKKIIPLLEDENYRVKTTACKILWKFGDLRVVGILKKMITQEPDKWHRAAAVFALGEIGGFQVLDLIYLALEDKEPEVLRNAIKSLAKCRELSSLPKIIGFLRHNDPTVQMAAIEALASIPAEDSFKALIKFMEETEDVEILDKLQKSITSITLSLKENIIGQLVVHLKNPHKSVRELSIYLLGEVGNISIAHFIEKIVNDDKEEENLRKLAEESLSKIRARDEE